MKCLTCGHIFNMYCLHASWSKLNDNERPIILRELWRNGLAFFARSFLQNKKNTNKKANNKSFTEFSLKN